MPGRISFALAVPTLTPAPLPHAPHPALRPAVRLRPPPPAAPLLRRPRGCAAGSRLQRAPRPGQRPQDREMGERVAASAAPQPAPPPPSRQGQARRARPDPCHGPPRLPGGRRSRPPHPNDRQGPEGAARSVAAGRGSVAASVAPGCSGQGQLEPPRPGADGAAAAASGYRRPPQPARLETAPAAQRFRSGSGGEDGAIS